jgi:ferredoxin
MKAIVDQALCIGCGLCELTCPEVFRMAEEGVAYVLTENPAPETYDDIRSCVELCPVSAIRVEG